MASRTRGSIARAVTVQVLGRAVGTAVSFGTLALTVRYLAPAEYGLLVTAVVFTGVFEAFAELGVGTAVVRRASSGHGSLERLVGLSLGMSALYALPVAALAVVGGQLVYGSSPQVQVGIAVLSVGLVCTVLSSCYEPVCAVTVRFGALALADVLSRVLSLVLVVVVVSADLGLVALFAVNAAPPMVRLIVLVLWVRRHGRFRPVLALRPSLELLREGLPFAVIIAIGVLYFRVDGLLLSVLSEPVEVAAYGLAYRIIANLAVVPNFLAEAVFSTLSRTWHESPARFQPAAGASLEAIVVFAVPLAVFGVLLAEDLVLLVASAQYAGAATPVLQLLSVATAFAAVNRLQAQVLAAAHQQRFLVTLSSITLALNVALNVALIPSLGAPGAAIALLLTELFSTVVAAWRVHAVSGYVLRGTFACRLVLTVAVTLTAHLAAALALPGLPVLVVFAVVGLSYAGALAAFEPIRVRDVRSLARG